MILRSLSPLTLAALALATVLASAFAASPFTTARSSSPAAKVVIVEDPNATKAYRAQADPVRLMVERGVLRLTGKSELRAAWLSIVSTQDVVGLKVYSKPGPNSGTRPAVVAAVVKDLIEAGLPPRQIIIWDREEADLRTAGFSQLGQELQVRVAAIGQAGWDQTNFYFTPLIGNLVFGDLEFEKKGDGVGQKSFVSKLVTEQMTKIINITPLLNNNEAGVCGNLYGLALDSVDNTLRFEGAPGRLAQAVPEIYALPVLGDRVVLNITDALICQYEGGQRGLLHYSVMLNQLRFSRDPVALDVLSIKELDRQRRIAHAANERTNLELYRNAALLELGVSDLSQMQIETVQ